jgi:DNA replication protein DnaC
MHKCQDGITTEYNDKTDAMVLGFCDCERGLYKRYRGVHQAGLYWSFDDFPGDADALALVKSLLWSDKWVILNGPYGSGKTSLAVCMYKAYIDAAIEKYGEAALLTGSRVSSEKLDDGTVIQRWHPFPRPAAFWNVTELLCASKNVIGRDDLIDPIETLKTRMGLLVLDGLGETKLSEWDTNQIGQLLGQRYNAWRTLRTVITTNWHVTDFGKHLGDWMTSRFCEVAEVITPKGKLR